MSSVTILKRNRHIRIFLLLLASFVNFVCFFNNNSPTFCLAFNYTYVAKKASSSKIRAKWWVVGGLLLKLLFILLRQPSQWVGRSISPIIIIIYPMLIHELSYILTFISFIKAISKTEVQISLWLFILSIAVLTYNK